MDLPCRSELDIACVKVSLSVSMPSSDWSSHFWPRWAEMKSKTPSHPAESFSCLTADVLAFWLLCQNSSFFSQLLFLLDLCAKTLSSYNSYTCSVDWHMHQVIIQSHLNFVWKDRGFIFIHIHTPEWILVLQRGPVSRVWFSQWDSISHGLNYTWMLWYSLTSNC